MQGKVKMFDPMRGYGFIAPDGGGKDVFFHVSALPRGEAFQNDKVTYQIGEDRGGRPPVDFSSECGPSAVPSLNDVYWGNPSS